MSSRRHKSRPERPAGRFIYNPQPEYATLVPRLGPKYTSTPDYKQHLGTIREQISSYCQTIERRWPAESLVSPTSSSEKLDKDSSIYTGAGGNAYLYWKLSRWWEAEGDQDKSDEYLLKALQAIETSLSLIKDLSGISFYIGAAGVYTMAAIIYHRYKEPVKVERYLHSVVSLLPETLKERVHNELLYGRAGYLSCLLLLKKYLPKELCQQVELDQIMRKVFGVVIHSGHGGNQHDKPIAGQYLKYLFYGTDYIGAAHGMAGVLFILLQFKDWCREAQIAPWIQQTLDHLLSLQFKSGNFPTKDYSDTRVDELVHWCHGAPGIANLLHQAYEVYNDEKYLVALDTSLKCIWKYGVLRKGFGLCHGICGNAYPFLTLYSKTQKDEYYYCAMQLGLCMLNKDVQQEVKAFVDPQRRSVGEPDHPYSLMEGLAGSLCFCCDLIHPELAAFPGYAGEF